MTRKKRAALVAAAMAAALGAGAHLNSYEFHLARVIDADTYEGAVLLMPGMPYTTAVRLRGVDTPETFRPDPACKTHERTLGKRATALARTALDNAVAIFIDWPLPDKYGGRIVADVTLVDDKGRETRIADLLIAAGLAVEYHGGKKVTDWCKVNR